MTDRSIPPDRLTGLAGADEGLTSSVAAERAARFGSNDIVVAPPSTWRDLVRDTAADPMIWFLLVVSVLFAVLGDYTEAAVLLAALVPLAGMDAYLHRRTQASTQGLASRLAAQAMVMRDGAFLRLPAREVVPGDLVEVGAGDYFPADGLIVAGSELQIDESSLTGETYPVRKHPLGRVPPDLRAANTTGWAFAGTRLLTGPARVRIIATGGETLYGEIVRSALSGQHTRTPLQQAVARLVTIMLAAAVALCVLLAGIRLAQGHGLLDAFLSAVTLAVAALPEEFPVVLTFFLGVGVYRLAHRQALVRRAVAVENIGRVTCICSDKTGTLTEGRLVLAHTVPAEGLAEAELVRWAALAARADSGDPMDMVLMEAVEAAAPARRIAAFPFTENRRRETAIVEFPDGRRAAAMKGAPETVLERCALLPEAAQAWRETIETYAAGGHKVIAVATRPVAAGEEDSGEPSDGFVFAGLLAFEDPVRDGVPEAVAACHGAGIRVIMVTGDHPLTAGAIGREIGLGGGEPVVVTMEALSLDGSAPLGRLHGIDVIARAAPAEKLRLVEGLQAEGEIVAVTGDGVNDVPALKAADVGIAMGERGTQSAREVAAIVLLDDNFRTIVRAIAEGRQLFRNLRLAFIYLLLFHIPFVLSAAVVPLMDHPLLYLPIHIVWLELIIHPTALLVFQDLPAERKLLPAMRNGPLRFFSGLTWGIIAGGGLLLTALIIFGFEQALGPDGAVAHARSLVVGILVAVSVGIVAGLTGFSTRPARVIAALSVLSFLGFAQIPAIARLMHLQPLHAPDLVLVCGAGLVAVALARGVKASLSRERPPAATRSPL